MNIVIKLYENKWMTTILWVLSCVMMTLMLPGSAYAAAISIGSAAQNITSDMGALAKLITAGSYVAGFGFAIGSILKFKAHKDNPQQIPVGTPIALLFVAAALIFLPSIFAMTGQTIFGGAASVGGVSGVTTFS